MRRRSCSCWTLPCSPLQPSSLRHAATRRFACSLLRLVAVSPLSSRSPRRVRQTPRLKRRRKRRTGTSTSRSDPRRRSNSRRPRAPGLTSMSARRQAHRVRSARRSLRDADRRDRRRPGRAPDERRGVRHAAAIQPRREVDRVCSDRDGLLNLVGDEAGWQRRAPGVEGEAVVREQPDVGAGQPVPLRPQPLREGTLARRRRDLDVPCQRR